MGYGRQGRGGSTSRHESNDISKEKKENKLAETDVSAEEIRRMVAKFLRELSENNVIVLLGRLKRTAAPPRSQ